ncbi:hypothetical protein [Paenibacillus kandeliae]|uniref:hypothetical protein n=1 Tax=Paenibacillus kandeliae TaxID=3231269 RepID=UPI003457416D
MAISSKGRRKIVCLDRDFYWYVAPDWEDAGQIKLHIISQDRKFVVSYHIGQSHQTDCLPFIVVQGKQFEGLAMDNGYYKRVLTPLWEDDVITPATVAKIIHWSFSTEVKVLQDEKDSL